MTVNQYCIYEIPSNCLYCAGPLSVDLTISVDMYGSIINVLDDLVAGLAHSLHNTTFGEEHTYYNIHSYSHTADIVQTFQQFVVTTLLISTTPDRPPSAPRSSSQEQVDLSSPAKQHTDISISDNNHRGSFRTTGTHEMPRFAHQQPRKVPRSFEPRLTYCTDSGYTSGVGWPSNVSGIYEGRAERGGDVFELCDG